MSNVQVVGVRHHSPACARLVRHTIESTRPDFVLIEGPADFNQRIDELLLEHRPPLAIFSYYQRHHTTSSCWTPLCDYSPEWVALREGHQHGARVLFMDLPAWSRPFWGVENRYADHRRPRLDYVEELCERTGMVGMDALWDHLFEQPLALSDLELRLSHYFSSLRECEPAENSDLEREKFMAGYLAWAAQQGTVVAVCGGFHKPALEQAWPEAEATQPQLPEPEEQARHGSFLVPYSFRRLDSFAGYASGMPSPYYYQCLWDSDLDRAAHKVTAEATQRLRNLKQPVSAADLIAARTMTEGLMRLRSHRLPARTDLLDGFASALVKEALEVPLPWTHRGPLAASTHPMLVEVVAAFSGQRGGELDPNTPLPPLVHDVRQRLKQEDLEPGRLARSVTVELDSPRSHLLHRLRLLGVPGFDCAQSNDENEAWNVSSHPHFESALIEAGAWGATLEQAAQSRLEELVAGCEGRLDAVARLLGEAYQAGLGDLSEKLLQLLEQQIQSENRFPRLGAAAGVLVLLWRRHRKPRTGTLLEMLCPRGLWLFESLCGEALPADPEMIAGVASLRDAYQLGQNLNLDPGGAQAVMRRRAVDREAPPAVRGSALGFLWSTSVEDELEQQTLDSVYKSSRPAELGDFLAGLFGLAREEVVGLAELVTAIDTVVCGFGDDDFLVAAPSLRLAFSYFPPREREQIARTILGIHGLDPVQAWTLVRLEVAPETLAAYHQLEAEVQETLERFGLL